ncbi:hypothetical protein BH20ACT23_BH20ACT23_23590 [soil metagenome]
MRIKVFRRPWALLCLLALVGASFPLAGTAVASHTERRLTLFPNKKNNPVGTSHTIRATLNPGPDSVPITVHFEVDGPGDPGPSGPGSDLPDSPSTADGNTPESPDRACTVPVGATSCEVSYRGSTEGLDEIRGWIDHDATVEADMGEGPDQSTHPGDQPEPDGTDVVQALWFVDLAPGATLNCLADDPPRPVGSFYRISCQLENSVGVPFPGWLIDGENLNGANDPNNSAAFGGGADYDNLCTTDDDGHCGFRIPSELPGEAGSAKLCFWVDEDEDPSFHQTPIWDGSQCDNPEDSRNHNTTDFVTAAWFVTLPSGAALECEPPAGSAPSSGPRSKHTIICSLTAGGSPLQGWRIDAENLDGANDPDDSEQSGTPDYNDGCTTGQSGACAISIPAAGEDGAADVCFWVDENIDDSFDPSGERWDGGDCDRGDPETTDRVKLTWAPTVRSVTLQASKDVATFGQTFTLSGSVESEASDCGGAVDVEIQRARGAEGAFETVQTVTTEGDGAYSLVLRADVSASYRAELPPAPACVEAESSQDRVDVRKKLSLGSKRKAVRPGRAVKLRVKVLSCTDGASDKVVLSKRVNGVFKRKAMKMTNDNCVASFSHRINKRSVFRAHSPQDADQLAGTSGRLVVRLK